MLYASLPASIVAITVRMRRWCERVSRHVARVERLIRQLATDGVQPTFLIRSTSVHGTLPRIFDATTQVKRTCYVSTTKGIYSYKSFLGFIGINGLGPPIKGAVLLFRATLDYFSGVQLAHHPLRGFFFRGCLYFLELQSSAFIYELNNEKRHSLLPAYIGTCADAHRTASTERPTERIR